MKHGISPTTPRNQVHEHFIHVSKRLVQRCEDMRWSQAREDDIVREVVGAKLNTVITLTLIAHLLERPRVRYIELNQSPAVYEHVSLVVPVKGETYRRKESKPKRPGLARRYKDRTLSELRRLCRMPKLVSA